MQDTTNQSQLLIPRSARLLSASDHGSRRKIHSTAFRYEPLEGAARRGVLYLAFEVETAPEQAENLQRLLIDTLKAEYYKTSTFSSEQAFEHAVSTVNDRLGDYAEESRQPWLNRLSVVISAIHGAQIYLTKTGRAEAYLFRRDTISQITEGLSESQETPHPLRTFSNVASGTIELGDKLVLATPGLFHQLSIIELKKILAEHNPSGAIGYLARVLEKEQQSKTSLVVLEISNPELAAHDFQPEGPSEIVMQPGKSHFRVPYLTGAVTFVRELTSGLPLEKLDPAKEKIEAISNKAMKQARRLYLGTKTEVKNWQSGSDTQVKVGATIDTASPIVMPSDTSVPSSKGYSWLAKAKQFGNYLLKPKILKLVATSAVVLLIVLIAGQLFTSSPRNLKLAQTALANAQQLFDQAQAQKVYDKPSAKKLLSEAITKNQEALATTATRPQAEELSTKLGTLSDELNLVSRLSELTIAKPESSGAPIALLSAGNNKLFLITGSEAFSINAGIVKPLSNFKPSQDVTAAAYLPSGNALYLALADGSLAKYDLAKGQLLSLLETSAFERAKSMDFNIISPSSASLYVLSNDEKIYTHAVTADTAAGTRTLYAAAPAGQSLVIARGVYVLSANSLLKLSRRQLVDTFRLSESIGDHPLGLAVGSNAAILTDSKQVMLFSDNGVLQKRIPLSHDAKFITIDSTNTLYSLGTDGTIYQYK